MFSFLKVKKIGLPFTSWTAPLEFTELIILSLITFFPKKWINSKGAFNWKNIDRLVFLAEHEAINNPVWFDSIKITK